MTHVTGGTGPMPPRGAAMQASGSTAPEVRPESTAPEARPESTAPEARPDSTAPEARPETVSPAVGGPTAERIVDAVVACASRWGIDKTTVEDVAREAGVSRATVYRVFPGGKPAMVRTATAREVTALLAGIREAVDACADLPGALTTAVVEGTAALERQPALDYMRRHQPSSVRAFLSFERLELLLGLTSELLAPALERFVAPDEASELVVWVARLVISNYLHPDRAGSLTDPERAARLVQRHLLPGLEVAPSGRPGSDRAVAGRHASAPEPIR